jgi:exodeoxyribonuclease VIII
MDAPEPGLYDRIPFEDYSRWDAVNHSRLRHFDKTPQHARHAMLHPKDSSEYQELGHAIHAALLEPQRFDDSYVVAPDVDRRRKEGKRIWKEFIEKHGDGTGPGDAERIEDKEMNAIRGIQANALKHATIKEALYGPGVSELSIVWIDRDTGLKCKARLDRLAAIGDWPFLLDIKSTHKPATLYNWQTAVNQYKLHQQAAHYLNGIETLRPLQGGLQRKFAWIVCETVGPFAVRIFQAEDAALDIGRDEVARNLARYKECVESDRWPGWSEGMELAGLPAWAYKQFVVD